VVVVVMVVIIVEALILPVCGRSTWVNSVKRDVYISSTTMQCGVAGCRVAFS